jgi:hypothetical protein
MAIFISHSMKDTAIYSTLCLALDAAGVNRWDPRKMTKGESLAAQLREAITACEACVFLATRRSIESQWCLAEVGAFWGAGKRVLIFMADTDLADTVLPPQFKGNLTVYDASELIEAISKAISDHVASNSKNEGEYIFYETSGNFGNTNDWQELFRTARTQFDLMGVALGQWKKTPGFREAALEKSASGCEIRILLMDDENPQLPGMLHNERPLDAVMRDIKESKSYYLPLADRSQGIQVRFIRRGIPHFFLTKTDQTAVLIQYLCSNMWGSGPTWKVDADSKFYKAISAEFEHLWETNRI